MAMPFTNLFAPFDRKANRKFQALRQAARARLQAMFLPTTRNEDWRFTNVAPIAETAFELPAMSEIVTILRGGKPIGVYLPGNAEDVSHLLPAARYSLRFVNGLLAQSEMWGIPEGVRVESLADAKAVAASLDQIASEKESVFTALNTSFLNDGALVVIPDGTAIDQPIEIEFQSPAADKPILSNTRTLIVVGKNAQATIVERYFGNGANFTNAVTEIALGEGAVVDHVKIQDESTTAYHIANTSVVMAARSNFTTHYLSLGGALVRNEVRVRFDGEHAEATVNGLYLAGGTQHIDNFTVIDHAQPNCASHELYKGILDGRSHGVFNGKIFVRKDAQKTDAKQTNKVLLLSDDATINTKPQLEIFADDVKCTHGATVGQLDATQLFYLQSRGIPLDAARKLLTFAFANDVVGRLKMESLREELEARIVK
jgi:Fe-S cluster assembly protein SufD